MNRVILDIETDGLEYTKVHCISGYSIEEKTLFSYVPNSVDLSTVPEEFSKVSMKHLKDFPLYAKTITQWIMHNGLAFDARVLRDVMRVNIPVDNIFDTLITSRLLFVERSGKKPHAVETYGEEFGIAKPEHEDWSQFSWEMLHRNLQDVRIQYKIYQYHMEKIRRKNIPEEVIRREHYVQRIMLQQTDNGFYLDRSKATALKNTLEKESQDLTQKIQKAFPVKAVFDGGYTPKINKDGSISKVGTKWVEDYTSQLVLHGLSVEPVEILGGPASKVDYKEFNLDSPKQRVERLMEAGWVPSKYTEAGNPQFDEKDLENAPESLPEEAKLLGRYLMTASRLRTVNQWLDLADDSNYVHGKIITIGTRTHRMAHRDPNMGNIPSTDSPYGTECRSCWTIEDKSTHTLIGADLSGIQLRALAHYAEDKGYTEQVVHGDIHAVHAEVLGCERSVAKTWIYAWLLNAGARKLGSILGGTQKDGTESNKIFVDRMPFLGKVKQNFENCATRREFKALDGRWIYIPSAHLALSTGLQSFEAIVMKWVLVEYHRDLISKRIWFKQRAVVHDEAQIETTKKMGEYVGNIFVQKTEEAGRALGSKCPLTAEWHAGVSWDQTH